MLFKGQAFGMALKTLLGMHLAGALGSRLLPGPALTIQGIWEMNQQIDLSLSLSQNLSLSKYLSSSNKLKTK